MPLDMALELMNSPNEDVFATFLNISHGFKPAVQVGGVTTL